MYGCLPYDDLERWPHMSLQQMAGQRGLRHGGLVRHVDGCWVYHRDQARCRRPGMPPRPVRRRGSGDTVWFPLKERELHPAQGTDRGQLGAPDAFSGGKILAARAWPHRRCQG